MSNIEPGWPNYTFHKHEGRSFSILSVMRDLESAKVKEIAKRADVTIHAIHSAIGKLVEDKLLVIAHQEVSKGGMKSTTYALRDELKAMSDAEFAQELVKIANMKKRQIKQNKPSQQLLAFLSDKDAVEFIKINHQYLPTSQIAKHLGVYFGLVLDALDYLGIGQLLPEGLDTRAKDIAKDLKFLPIGTEIQQGHAGTIIHMPSGRPGINRVTRYFADE